MRGELSFKKGITFTVFEPDAATVADVMAEALDRRGIKYRRSIVAVPIVLKGGASASALAEQLDIDPEAGSAHVLDVFKSEVLPNVLHEA